MENHLKHRPKLGKEQNDLLNAIVNRSRKRKPENKNEEQTRKNRNVVKQIIRNMKTNTSDYDKTKNWLDTFDSLLKEQEQDAIAYIPATKPKRKIKLSQALLEKVADKALKDTAQNLKEEGVKPIETPAEKPAEAAAETTTAPKKRTLKIKVAAKPPATTTTVVEPPKPPTPKMEQGKFPILYTKSKAGKVQQWQVEVKKGPGDTAIIFTQWGYKDGKQATSEKEIKEGKNKGRSNETTPFEQAVAEAKSAWEKKKTSDGYAESVADAAIPGVASAAKTSEEVLLPMLAQNYRKRATKIEFPCYVQAKLDGVRSLFRNGVFTSRTAKPFGFLDHITSELQPAIDAGLILDGEIYSTTLPFQEFVGLVKKKHLTAKDIENLKKVNLWVYDMVSPHPFEKRLATLVKFFNDHQFTHVHLLPTEECKTVGDIKTFHDKYVEAGYEGLIIRNKKGLYRLATRSDNLQKYKEFEDAEFKIVDFIEGEGVEKGAVVWICETESGKRFKVRPMGTFEERKELFKEGDKYIGKKLTVKYQEMTADGIPRFGVGIAIRDYE